MCLLLHNSNTTITFAIVVIGYIRNITGSWQTPRNGFRQVSAAQILDYNFPCGGIQLHSAVLGLREVHVVLLVFVDIVGCD